MGTGQIKVDINVKFRAFGVTFGSYSKTLTQPLSGVVGKLTAIVPAPPTIR
jgi:hypothetical protein